ncbi:MAG: hypothetical protein MJ200_00730 [Mycoplasmoidaceae bacterium]|nr:hypothetical protein [Mycoplasmoidaceae bacterium]
MATSLLTVGASSLVITSCNNDEHEPEPTETVKITFDANGGEVIKNGTTETIEVPKGTV